MHEVEIDAGEGEHLLPTTCKPTRALLRGVRRPVQMVELNNAKFDRLEKESYSLQMRGVPAFYTIKEEPYRICILPHPTGKVTVMLETPEELIPDGLDTTWQRTSSPR